MDDYKMLYTRLLDCAAEALQALRCQNYGCAAAILERGIDGRSDPPAADDPPYHSAAAYLKRHPEIR